MHELLAPQLAKYFPAELRESRHTRGPAVKKRKMNIDLAKLEKTEKSGVKTEDEREKKDDVEEDEGAQQAEDEMVKRISSCCSLSLFIETVG